MNKKKKIYRRDLSTRRTRLVRAGIFASVLIVAGAVTAIAKYESRQPVINAPAQPASNFVTVEVGGKKLRVNASTLQQGPLTQDQSQQIADALKDNKSTDGLVQVQHANGTVEMDLQGRFQNVMLAKKNDDGSVSEACVDSSEAASAFMKGNGATASSERNRKAAAKE